MRSKLFLAALLFLATLPVAAQVAPAVNVGGLPLGIGVGLSDYDTDYYKPYLPNWSGRMIGLSAWADYNIFRGLGVEAEGTDIFANEPTPTDYVPLVSKDLNEKAIKGGVIYKYHTVFKVRPYVKGLIGISKINFPSNNLYTNDTYTVEALGGGIEYRAWRSVFIRADYEWERWPKFRQSELNPNGFTVGATYYLRGVHRHY